MIVIPDPVFAARRALRDALAAAAAAYAEATGERPYLAASIGAEMLYRHAAELHDEYARTVDCATTI